MKKIPAIIYFVIVVIVTAASISFITCGSDSSDSSAEPTATPTLGPTATPTFNVAECTTCHNYPPSSGHHNSHNGSFCCECLACHYSSVDADNNLLGDHNNGNVDVVFESGGSWDGSGCFGLTSGCHGDRLW